MFVSFLIYIFLYSLRLLFADFAIAEIITFHRVLSVKEVTAVLGMLKSTIMDGILLRSTALSLSSLSLLFLSWSVLSVLSVCPVCF